MEPCRNLAVASKDSDSAATAADGEAQSNQQWQCYFLVAIYFPMPDGSAWFTPCNVPHSRRQTQQECDCCRRKHSQASLFSWFIVTGHFQLDRRRGVSTFPWPCCVPARSRRLGWSPQVVVEDQGIPPKMPLVLGIVGIVYIHVSVGRFKIPIVPR